MSCTRCERLVRFRGSVPAKPKFATQRYWRKPVPGFGDHRASLAIIGLAPAAHGGNRTGRVFTGDESGRFLVRALHKTGFANQPVSESRRDGLRYVRCYLTAAVKCAPPGDRPTTEEFANCGTFLSAELELLPRLSSVLALGRSAFRACLRHAKKSGARTNGMEFVHGRRYDVGGLRLYCSYHPSPRNTRTGKLSERSFVSLLTRIRSEMDAGPRSSPPRSRMAPVTCLGKWR